MGGVNTQHMQAAKGWGKGPKGMGKPGTPRSQWGEVWNSKGKGHLGKGHAWGDRWGQRRTAGHQALTVAPAVCLGKGTFPWGGRGRGWGQRVQQVPYCSNPPGRPPWREGPTLLGNQGGGTKGGKPGTLSNQLGIGWNGRLERGHCPRGDQWGRGRNWNKGALAAAPAVVLGKGAMPWGGRGRGWGQEVQQAPCCSNLPVNPRHMSALAQLACKGGGAKGGGNPAKGEGQWQEWRRKGRAQGQTAIGSHTISTSNYWGVLQKSKSPAVRPGEQRLQGADEEPSVPIRNSGVFSCKGRNSAPSREVSQSASWGGGT